MKSGELRHRVTLERTSDSSDWGRSGSWLTYATVWARVQPISGREFQEGRLDRGELTHVVTIRYLAGVRPDMRINFEGRYLKIVAVRDLEERNRTLELDCNEEV